MGEVISIKGKRETEEKSLRDTMVESLNALGKEDIECGIVLIMKKDGQALSGYFNTSFRDEAVLAKVLEIDTHNRQYLRETEGNE